MPTQDAGGAAVTGALTGVADTAALFGAALEMLNRNSAVELLRVMIEEIHLHTASSDNKLNTDVEALKTQMNQTLFNIHQGTQTAEGRITAIEQKVLEVKNAVDGFLNAFPGQLAAEANARLSAKTPGIVNQFKSEMQARTTSMVEQYVHALQLNETEAKLAELNAELAEVKAKAQALDANELAQIVPLISSALDALDLSATLASAMITVNGAQMRLDQLVKALAVRPNVANVDLSYDDSGITGAEFTLSDSKKVLFVANRVELPDLSVNYEFRTYDLYGLPAEFEMRFQSKSWKAKVGDKMLMMDQYEPVYQSRVLYTLSVS